MKIVDANGVVLGRLATQVSKVLLSGEDVVIINAENAIVTGEPKQVIAHYRMKKNVTHIRKGPYYPRMPDRIVKFTVRGMLPNQKSNGRSAYKRLRVYIGTPAEYTGKKTLDIKYAKRDLPAKFITIGEVSRSLGAKF